MESHDEERTMWESLTHGQTSPLNIQQLKNAVNRNQLMAAFFFSIPGPKMLWQFEEFGYDLELNNDRLGIKPTRWNYLDDPERQRLFRLYKAMIHLKNEHNAFNKPENAMLNLGQAVKSIRLVDGDFNVVLHGNFGLTTANNVALSFPKSGKWYNYFTGEEIEVTGNSKTFRLRPSEFMLFTSDPLETPEGQILMEDLITSIDKEEVDLSGFKIYPVPASNQINISFPKGLNQFNYRVLDVKGSVLAEGSHFTNGDNLQLDIREFKAGLYIFEIFDSRQVLRKRFIKR